MFVKEGSGRFKLFLKLRAVVDLLVIGSISFRELRAVDLFTAVFPKFSVVALLLNGFTNCGKTILVYYWLWSHPWDMLSVLILLHVNCTLKVHIAFRPACRDPISFQNMGQVLRLESIFGCHVNCNAFIDGGLLDITRFIDKRVLLILKRIIGLH